MSDQTSAEIGRGLIGKFRTMFSRPDASGQGSNEKPFSPEQLEKKQKREQAALLAARSRLEAEAAKRKINEENKGKRRHFPKIDYSTYPIGAPPLDTEE